MDLRAGAAARLPESDRKNLAVQALARSETVSDLAARHGVSRKFVYQQTRKVRAALDEGIASVVTRLCPYHRSVRSSILPILGKLGQA